MFLEVAKDHSFWNEPLLQPESPCTDGVSFEFQGRSIPEDPVIFDLDMLPLPPGFHIQNDPLLRSQQRRSAFRPGPICTSPLFNAAFASLPTPISPAEHFFDQAIVVKRSPSPPPHVPPAAESSDEPAPIIVDSDSDSSPPRPSTASSSKTLKRARDASVTDGDRTRRFTKKLRKTGESVDSKDPKYVLTPQVVEDGDKRYCRVFRRPPVSYADLITYAIAQSPEKKLKLCSIYQFLNETFGYFKFHPGKRGWENSIRHNLSMKSKGRFLKIKENNDSEKGSFWHLNTEENQFRLAMESALETSEKLESWVGIVYYELYPDEVPALDSVIFREEDRHYLNRLFIFEQGHPTKFVPQDWDSLIRKKSATDFSSMLDAGSVRLRPPPYRNLNAIVSGGEETGFEETPIRRHSRPAACKGKSTASRARASRKTASCKTQLPEARTDFDAISTYSPIAALAQLSSSEVHLSSGEDQQAPMDDSASTSCDSDTSLGEIEIWGNSRYVSFRRKPKRIDYDDFGRTPAPTRANSETPSMNSLFSDDDGSRSTPSLLFDQHHLNDGMAFSFVNMSNLDLERLIADPSVPTDCTFYPWFD
ncbi:fork head domain-containing protein [Zopfochytrium polystomum]|nr:fork head domain-containing protein [Zopfochytrium polystomum]